MPAYPNLVMFEGIDGSGKTTLARFFAELLATRGKTIFDLPETSKKTGEIPLPRQPKNEVIFTAEPTQVWIGAAIRNEFIRKGTSYDALSVAQAFSLDRLLLYTRFLVPMLKAGALIVQDRGLPSSMTYQPIMKNGVPLEDLLDLSGNKLALEHAPGQLVIAKCSAETAISRLAARSEKTDDAIFEKREFLEKLSGRYSSGWFRRIWEDRGTKIRMIDAEQPLEAVKADIAQLAEEIFPA